MPADSGMAFVVVTHQAHAHESLLPELLRHHTTMQVHEVTASVAVEPNTIYLSSPGLHLALLHGVLQPMPVDETHGVLQFPINYFSAAGGRSWDKAISIVLSGTGTDGTLGCAVKEAGGLVIVQSSSREVSGDADQCGRHRRSGLCPATDSSSSAACLRLGPHLQAEVSPTFTATLTPDVLRQIHVLLRNVPDRISGNQYAAAAHRTADECPSDSGRQSVLRYLREYPHELDLLFQELLPASPVFRDPRLCVSGALGVA